MDHGFREVSVHHGGESIVAAVKVALTWQLTRNRTRGIYHPQRPSPSDVLLLVPLSKYTTVEKIKNQNNNSNNK